MCSPAILDQRQANQWLGDRTGRPPTRILDLEAKKLTRWTMCSIPARSQHREQRVMMNVGSVSKPDRLITVVRTAQNIQRTEHSVRGYLSIPDMYHYTAVTCTLVVPMPHCFRDLNIRYVYVCFAIGLPRISCLAFPLGLLTSLLIARSLSGREYAYLFLELQPSECFPGLSSCAAYTH